MPRLAKEMPYIDPDVEHVGVSTLRTMNAASLRDRSKTLVIRDNNTPVAVLLAYESFLSMQEQIEQLLSTVELLSDDEERRLLLAGLKQYKAGKMKSLEDIEKSLRETADVDEMD